MNQRDRDAAIQAAMSSSKDPAVVAALANFQRSGVPPTDPAAIAIYAQAVQALGLGADPAVFAPALDNSDPYAAAQAAANQAGAATPDLPAAGAGGAAAPVQPPASIPGGGAVGGARDNQATAAQASGAPGGPAFAAAAPMTTGLPSTAPPTTSTTGPGTRNKVDAALNGNERGQLRELLRMVGVDPDNLGLTGGNIANTLLPIMQAKLKTSGMIPGSGIAGDNVMGTLEGLGGMFNSDKGFYGQLQDYGHQLQSGAMDMLGKSNDIGQQQEYLNMINMLSSVGGNDLSVKIAKQQGDKALGAFSDANTNAAKTGAAAPNNYIKWLQGQQAGGGGVGFEDILRMVNGGR